MTRIVFGILTAAMIFGVYAATWAAAKPAGCPLSGASAPIRVGVPYRLSPREDQKPDLRR